VAESRIIPETAARHASTSRALPDGHVDEKEGTLPPKKRVLNRGFWYRPIIKHSVEPFLTRIRLRQSIDLRSDIPEKSPRNMLETFGCAGPIRIATSRCIKFGRCMKRMS
jgi:hypothetical protein